MENIVQCIRQHASDSPQRIALTYLRDDGSPEEVTCAGVLTRANAVADYLRSRAQPRSLACLAYPHSLEFVWAFLGCLLAGVVAIPCAPPNPRRKRSFARLESIVRHACPDLILTSSSVGRDWFADLAASTDAQIIVTDTLPRAAPDVAYDPVPEQTAFIQYTSGSTGHPKGVIVTHRNLVANETAIQAAFEHGRDSIMVSWLPMFHDMGLVGGILQPLFVGFPSVLFSPGSFLENPLRWLEAVTRYRGTTTGAPNVAYELCANGVSEAQKENLDLSSLRAAYNGSEPVLPETLDRFNAAFAACGFRQEAFFPCYGLAECTLLVSGGPPLRGARRLRVRRAGLEKNKIVVTPCGDDESVELVACGEVAQGTHIAIVDPQTLKRCDATTVGEIWIRGEGVASGYFRDAAATRETFAGVLEGDSAEYLRTGDLGFMSEHNEIFVTGRLKDLIVIAGRNIYPQDVERCAANALSVSARFRCAAIGSEAGGTQRLSIIVEANSTLRRMISDAVKRSARAEIDEQTARVRRAVLDEFGILVDQIAFVKAGSLPQTTSSKLRRSAGQAMLVPGHPDVVYSSSWHGLRTRERSANGTWDQLKQMLAGMLIPEQRVALEPYDEATNSLTLEELGVDSLASVSLAAEIERTFNVQLDDSQRLRTVTLKQLVCWIDNASQRPAPNFARQSDRMRPIPIISSVDSRLTSLTDFADRQSRDMLAKTSEFRSWLEDADVRGFKRYLLPVINQAHGRAVVAGNRCEGEREVILFASADYLGLAHDPRVKRAAADAIMAHGCNVASVPLIAGSTPIHKLLEGELSQLVGTESCVLFPTGHSANMATIAALCSTQDTVVVDNRVHYSILEGARLAHCRWTTFLHNSPESLQDVLSSVRSANDSRGVLVVLEGVYGIDGDLANLSELMEIARQFDARVMLDDAHGIGVLGPHGEGTAAQLGCRQEADIVMGSLSKALGSFGGFIAASQDTVDYLRFFAKAISFAVGLPGSNAAAALESLAIMRESPDRMKQLRRKAGFFRDALINEGFSECAVSQSTIMSITIGEETLLRDVVRELFEQGIWAEGLPFPAVARGQERIRFRVRLDHADEDLLRAANVVGSVHRRLVRSQSRAKCSQPDRLGGFHEVVVDQPSPEQVEELCNASIRQAQQRNTPLPWISREFITKYFARSGYWSETASSRTWHLGYRSGKLVTAFQVDRTPVSVGGTMVSAALLGSLICEPDCEDLLQQQVYDALQQLGQEVECVVAPASYPVQVFGCGIQAWRSTDGRPFLETSYPDELLDIWERADFRRAGSKCYRRIELSSEAKPVGGLGHSTTVRDFRRADFITEIDRIAPILDQTLGRLDLCAPVPKAILHGLIQDLRELVLPGLWLVAEHGQQTVGFAFCYPNVTAEFERIQGNADVADFQLIQQAMETSSEAFLAWLAVDPAYADQGVAERLLSELRGRLAARGCTHVWMSWEIVDGNRSLQQLAQSLGHVVRVAEMPYFMTSLGTRHAPRPAVPEPHFSARSAHGPAPDEPPMSPSDVDSPLSR